MEVQMKPMERLDILTPRDLKILQRTDGFRYGTDAIVLAHFVGAKRGETLVDMGTGTGIMAMIMAKDAPGSRVHALEIQPDMADMASRSVALNGMQDRVTVHAMDLKEAPRLLGHNIADRVVCNPPYIPVTQGPQSTPDNLNLARHEIACTMDDVMEAGYRLLRNKGRMCVIYPATRTAEILVSMTAHHLSPKRIQLIQPTYDAPPGLIMVEGIRNGNPGVMWLPPLIMRDRDGEYTAQAKRYYHLEE
jgi:tRNA1Val (adenine37-N6)-methyltransferase